MIVNKQIIIFIYNYFTDFHRNTGSFQLKAELQVDIQYKRQINVAL